VRSNHQEKKDEESQEQDVRGFDDKIAGGSG